MIWIEVAIGVVCGLLAAAAGTLIVRARDRGYLRAIVSIVVLAGLLAASRLFVTPHLQARYATARSGQSLLANPALAAIREHDAATYARIMGELSTTAKGRTAAQTTAAARSSITTLVQERVPHASDEAAAAYMKVTVQEMIELQRNGGDELCYRFLFPQPGRPIDLDRYVSEATMQDDFEALARVVRTSAAATQEIPSQADAWALLEPVVKVLLDRFGQDAALLQNPAAPDIDKGKVCTITTEMYRLIVELPPEQGGKLVRYLLAQS